MTSAVTAAGTTPILQVEGLHVAIQSMPALRGVSLAVAPGATVGLIGRNGAGKTTLMRTVMGHLKAARGRVTIDGRDVAGLPAHERAPLGIGYMPEDRQLVPELTVEENVLLPLWVSRTLDARSRLAHVYGVLPELEGMRDRKAPLLSGGQQKLVALGRALGIGTRLLLLDEPFEGVAPALSQRLSEVIFGLRDGSLAVLISQSDVNHSTSLLDRQYVIERGANSEARHAA